MNDEASKNVPIAAERVVAFWRDAGPSLWFSRDDAFDARFRTMFIDLHEAAARGELDHWQATPEGALALLLLLDQFPRNAFRGTPRVYESDVNARQIAAAAVAAGHDRHVDDELRTFLYLPFSHSEAMEDQTQSVLLFRQIGGEDLAYAERHHDIVRRFGRFPHRNVILGRITTDEEQRFLDEGGFSG
jgi:uncharacterized protein (DUF924 family)